MTLAVCSAAQGLTRHAALSLAVGLMALALGGCETGSLLSSGSPGTKPAASITPTSTATHAKVAIADPIIGPPLALAQQMRGKLTTAMVTRSVPVVAAKGGEAEYTIRGYVSAAADVAGTNLSYVWYVTDKAGNKAHVVQGEELLKGKKAADPWSVVDAATLQNLVEQSATKLAAWVPKKSAAPALASAPAGPTAPRAAVTPGVAPAAKPRVIAGMPTTVPATVPKARKVVAPVKRKVVRKTIDPVKPKAVKKRKIIRKVAAVAPSKVTGPVSAIVPSVIGAPGDGKVSLTKAIKRQLQIKGVRLASAASTATYKVSGKVTMGTPAAGKQQIRIEWRVIDPKGKRLGTVSQKNVIPQGSLDGPWGRIADAAAAAAAQGIVKLLPKAARIN